MSKTKKRPESSEDEQEGLRMVAALVDASNRLPASGDLLDGANLQRFTNLTMETVQVFGSLRDSVLNTRFLKNAIRLAPPDKMDPKVQALLSELVDKALVTTAMEYGEAGFIVGVAAGLRGFGREWFKTPKAAVIAGEAAGKGGAR
jgi:hypothetical protein